MSFKPRHVPWNKGKGKLLRPEEVAPEYRRFYDFTRQVLRPSGQNPPMRTLFIWVTCPRCHQGRWQRVNYIRRGSTPYCRECSRHVRSDGKYVNKDGYVMVYIPKLPPADQVLARAMRKDQYVLEHRLVMARYLGRPLRSNEHVHHRNGNKADNRLANLRLVSPNSHNKAPADKIAKLTVEIEAVARELTAAGVDGAAYLEKMLQELQALLPDRLV